MTLTLQIYVLDVPFATVLLNFCIIGLINSVILTLVFHVYYDSNEAIGGLPNNISEWLIVAAIGLLSFVGQASLTISLQIEAAGIISLIRKAFALIFAYTFQVALFQVIRNV